MEKQEIFFKYYFSAKINSKDLANYFMNLALLKLGNVHFFPNIKVRFRIQQAVSRIRSQGPRSSCEKRKHTSSPLLLVVVHTARGLNRRVLTSHENQKAQNLKDSEGILWQNKQQEISFIPKSRDCVQEKYPYFATSARSKLLLSLRSQRGDFC